MQIAVLYLSSLVIFLGLDAVMLKLVMRPLFQSHLGALLMPDPRMVPAALFYLVYIAGLIWLVSLPALRSANPMQALIAGAVVGAMAYGTYEFSNYATLGAWSPVMVAIDTLWGTCLTALTAWAGVAITRAIFPA